MKELTSNDLIPGEFYRAYDDTVDIVFQFLRPVPKDPTRVICRSIVSQVKVPPELAVSIDRPDGIVSYSSDLFVDEEARRASIDERNCQLADVEDRLWLKTCMLAKKGTTRKRAIEMAFAAYKGADAKSGITTEDLTQEKVLSATEQATAMHRPEHLAMPIVNSPLNAIMQSLENKRYRIGYINTDEEVKSTVVEAKSLQLAIKQIEDFKTETYHIEI